MVTYKEIYGINIQFCDSVFEDITTKDLSILPAQFGNAVNSTTIVSITPTIAKSIVDWYVRKKNIDSAIHLNIAYTSTNLTTFLYTADDIIFEIKVIIMSDFDVGMIAKLHKSIKNQILDDSKTMFDDLSQVYLSAKEKIKDLSRSIYGIEVKDTYLGDLKITEINNKYIEFKIFVTAEIASLDYKFRYYKDCGHLKLIFLHYTSIDDLEEDEE